MDVESVLEDLAEVNALLGLEEQGAGVAEVADRAREELIADLDEVGLLDGGDLFLPVGAMEDAAGLDLLDETLEDVGERDAADVRGLVGTRRDRRAEDALLRQQAQRVADGRGLVDGREVLVARLDERGELRVGKQLARGRDKRLVLGVGGHGGSEGYEKGRSVEGKACGFLRVHDAR